MKISFDFNGGIYRATIIIDQCVSHTVERILIKSFLQIDSPVKYIIYTHTHTHNMKTYKTTSYLYYV